MAHVTVTVPLPKATQHLVMLRASQINGCGLCVDIHTKEATADGETSLRLNLVAAWRETTVSTDDQIGVLVSLVAPINAANRFNVIVRSPGGSYEPGMVADALS